MLLNPCIVNYSLENVSSIAHLHSTHTNLKIPVDLIVQAATSRKTQQDHVKLHAYLHSSLMIQPIDVCWCVLIVLITMAINKNVEEPVHL